MQNIFNKNRLAGFTLIEMFIVIAVIGILAGVVFRGTAVIQATARDARRISDLRSIQSHLETYFMMCGHYPGGFSAGRCSDGNSGISELRTALNNANIVLTDDFPTDPIRDRVSFGYQSASPNTGYVLGVLLERHHRLVEEGHQGTILTGFPACGASTAAGTMLCVTN